MRKQQTDIIYFILVAILWGVVLGLCADADAHCEEPPEDEYIWIITYLA